MEGLFFNIQRFSIHDGPGIRTTVFLKGCNLRCFWCHNPESRSPRPQMQFFQEKCILCGRCVEVCPRGAQLIVEGTRIFDRSACDDCGLCAEECFAKALVESGEVKTTAEVFAEIQKDAVYYHNSGGGVTFSGGEPLLQLDCLVELLSACKQAGYHTAVDTAGSVDWERFAAVLPYTDLFLFDIKAWDEDRHKKAVGAGSARIHHNLLALGEHGAKIHVRIPVIPGVNADLVEMQAIGAFLRQVKGLELVELLPFHHLGSGKYRSLGLEYPTKALQTPSAEVVDCLAAALADLGLNVRRPA